MNPLLQQSLLQEKNSHKSITTVHYEFYEILLQINCLDIFLVIFNLLMDCVVKHVIPGANNFKNVFILSP